MNLPLESRLGFEGVDPGEDLVDEGVVAIKGFASDLFHAPSLSALMTSVCRFRRYGQSHSSGGTWLEVLLTRRVTDHI